MLLKQYIFIKAGVKVKPALFHSINLPQQGEPERKCLAYDAVDSSISLQVTTYTRVRLPYIRCPNLVGGANTRVRLNGRKQRRPGSLRRWVLNSEVGVFAKS